MEQVTFELGKILMRGKEGVLCRGHGMHEGGELEDGWGWRRGVERCQASWRVECGVFAHFVW